MMVAERATTPESAAPCSEQNNHPESITPEPSPATCAYCGAQVGVYRLGADQWICTDHIGLVVSLAANDVWPDMVSYTREFEDVLLC